jgi:tetratricopeptide (TPR) repeat protein
MILVARRREYGEGIDALERAVEIAPDDAGLWYSLGWCCEFAAHELQRRPDVRESPDVPYPTVREMYERAAEAFRRCLALNPEGKLYGDAEDLLDHVENELRSL